MAYADLKGHPADRAGTSCFVGRAGRDRAADAGGVLAVDDGEARWRALGCGRHLRGTCWSRYQGEIGCDSWPQPPCGASTASTAQRSKLWPRRKFTASTMPSRGALTAISSFMLSITSSVSPAKTASPGAIGTAITDPGMGARTASSVALPASLS